MATSRTGRTEDAAWGERRPLAAKAGEKCGLGGVAPTVEAGGWNAEGAGECVGLDVSKRGEGAKRELRVTATVSKTFLDGSRVYLRLNGKPVASVFVDSVREFPFASGGGTMQHRKGWPAGPVRAKWGSST